MTVLQNNNLGQAQIKNKPNKFLRLNATLLGLAMILLFVFVYLSDRLVSHKFSSNLMESQLARANVTYELKNSEVTGGLNIDLLNQFAKNRGMVEAKDGISVYEDGGMAMFGTGMP